MTREASKLLPVWHTRIEPLSRYSPEPVFRASPALLDRASDHLTAIDNLAGHEHLRDFTVTASIEPSENGNQLWGYRHGYSEPYTVDLWRAETMVKTLRLVDRGIRAHEARFGCLGANNGVGYLAVIASVLKMQHFVIEGEDDDRTWMSGERYRLVDAAALKSIVSNRVERLSLR